jgi:peptide/nickel transport system substrate-binding protein
MRVLSAWRGACVFVGTVALLAGCGRGDTGATGGTAIIGSGQDPKTLFPPTADNVVARQIDELIFERLADRGAALNTVGDSGFVPRLAKSWEWSADSMRVTFHLDPLARWQDGHTVSAGDVRFGWDVFTDSLVRARVRGDLLSAVDSITIGDSVTCTAWFHGKSLERFDVLVTSLYPLPAHIVRGILRDSLALSAYSTKPVGNGPFKLVAWDQQVRLEIAPSETYHGARPALDRVIWAFATSPATLFKQFTAGESDFLENISTDDAASAAKQPDVRIARIGGYGYNYLSFNLHDNASEKPHPLFGDRALRRALTMAIDRQLLVRSVFDSLGVVGLGPFVRVQWATDTTVAQIGFNRERAKQLLDSLGWRAGADGMRARNGKPLAFSVIVPVTSKARQTMAVLIQEQLRLAGVNMSIEMLDTPAMQARLQAQHKFDAWMGGITAGPSPGGVKQTWTTAATHGGLNFGRYESNAFDAQIDSAVTATAKKSAIAHYRAANQIIVDDAPAVWLYEPPLLTGANARLRTGLLRADAWWMGVPGWSIAPGKRLPRDAPVTKAP